MKHERCSKSVIIREMQIKTTVKCCLPIRLVKNIKFDSKYGKEKCKKTRWENNCFYMLIVVGYSETTTIKTSIIMSKYCINMYIYSHCIQLNKVTKAFTF